MPRHTIALLIAAAVGLTACTGGPPPETATGTSPATSTSPKTSVAPAPWSLELPVIGQPVAAGDGVVVTHTASAGALAVVGVDAATGEQLWSRPASPGFVVPGISIEPEVVEDAAGREYVAYFRPDLDTSLSARLVVADPRTGDDVAATELTSFTSPPGSCDDGLDVCVDVEDSSGRGPRRLRLADGALVREPSARGYVRPIGPLGLADLREYDVRGQEHEYLARIEDGSERWRIPVEDAFGPGASTNGGWGWQHFEVAGLLVGWIGRAFKGDYSDPQVIDLGDFSTVALVAETGRVAWRAAGTGPLCRSALTLPAVVGDAHEEAADLAVRCRYQGVMTASLDGDPTFRGLDVEVQGYDVSTGRVTWQLPMGASEGLAWDGGVGDVAVMDELVLPTTDGPIAIDLRTGAQRRPAPDEVLACVSATVEFEYDDPYVIDGKPLTTRHGGPLIQWCGPDRVPSEQAPSPELLAAVGTRMGEYYVVATPSGLSGYPDG